MDMLGGFGTPASSGVIRYPQDYAQAQAAGLDLTRDSFTQDELDGLPGEDRRWSWVEIDLGAIAHNVNVARHALKNSTRLMAVVKADAYGHGAVRVARTALHAGANQLAVATVDEGVKLRQAGITAPIVLLSEPPLTAVPLLLHYNIIPSVYTAEFAIGYAEIADTHNLKAPFHLAINTGMNRIGVKYDEASEFVSQISFHRALEQVGTFTHFATADCPETFDFNIQFSRFKDAVESIRNSGGMPGLVHCANSAALLRYPETHFDMARLGISLYGYHPCAETQGYYTLKPAMSVHARITAVNSPALSEGVSYGMHYRSLGTGKICVVPIGYADGLPRALSGRTGFVYNGRVVRQVGNICMDQCMFEVDMRRHGTRPLPEPQVGDEVLIAGEGCGASVPIEELSVMLGTIPHELCCGFGIRMPRVYK